MTNKELDDLIEAVDKESFKWDFEYSKAFEAIYEGNEKKLTEDQKELLRSEVYLFRLRTINRFEDPKQPRFAPMMVYTNGAVFPDPDGFSSKDIAYFEKRAEKTTHSTLKARYLDIVWEKGGNKGKFNTGKKLIEAYIDAYETYPHDSEIERLDCIYRAIEIAFALEKKNPGVLTQTVTKVLDDYIEKLYQSKKYRWLLDAIQSSVRKIKNTPKVKLQTYLGYVDEAIDHYTKEDDNFTLREAFFKLKTELSSASGLKTYTAKDEAEDIAKSHIAEAERRTDSIFVQQYFYGEAAEVYRKAGLADKADGMVRKIRELGQSKDYDKQFKVFSHDVVIPTEEIDKLKKALGSGTDLPLILGFSKNFVPDWEAAAKLAEELGKKYPMQRIFRSTTIGNEGYAVANTNTDEDYIMQQFHTQASLKHAFNKQFLREKIDKKEVRFSDFTKLFKKIRMIDEDTYDTIKKGLRSYFRKDYLSANVVLTTQLEDLLRQLMPMFGLNPTRQIAGVKGVYEEKTLNQILKEYRPRLGENTYQNLVYVLIDKRNHYLRHKDAHGFIKAKDDNELYAVIVIQLYCILLAPLQIKKRRKP